jgi:hypothetical protein
MITLIAFIINIGIFVKAKINLQNATDAAAYAGASVQSRQLTNIAYMNWEMRNIYKEWMFKYYVLGGLNLKGVIDPSGSSDMDFTMGETDTRSSTFGKAVDQYNFPSVCIDFSNTGSVGLCTKYLVPGLPRFRSENVLGMDETTNAFIDAIVSEKALDCSERTQINFLTASTWAYNVHGASSGLSSINEKAPQIVANRMGAFPDAFETALRIRNLEAQVNAEPVLNVCLEPGKGANCKFGINELVSTNPSPSQERLYKAFYSGYRNLGSEGDSQLRKSFTLSELAPLPNNPQVNQAYSLSSLLIPEGSTKKIYLDLQLQTVNYSMFYTAFTSNQGEIGTSEGNVASEGQCTATKIGLPVPGYPIGYVKNPTFITYYAVKGKANFNGLFNPFTEPVTLTAYAAAKPFGGRIGPMLFDTSDGSALKSRNGTQKKSSAYISGLDLSVRLDQYEGGLADATKYVPGTPLPLNTASSKFWLEDATNSIGGWVTGTQISFGIPNLVYDYPQAGQFDSSNSFQEQNDGVQIIKSKHLSTKPKAGLYNSKIFQRFSEKLTGIGGAITVDNIEKAIIMARSPTEYDAHNYLIPTPEIVNLGLKTDSFGVIPDVAKVTYTDSKGRNHAIYDFKLYAPLYATPDTPDALYKTSADIVKVLDTYLTAQTSAIRQYVAAMNLAANEIYKGNISGATAQNAGEASARVLSDIPELGDLVDSVVAGGIPTCASMAGKFAHFYLGNAPSVVTASGGCSSTLRELLLSRWSESENAELRGAYVTKYSLPEDSDLKSKIFSAYRPGVEHDAPSNDGIRKNASNSKQSVKIRNYYSTKFSSINALSSSQSGLYKGAGTPTLSEGSDQRGEFNTNFMNPLEVNNHGIDLSIIKH